MLLAVFSDSHGNVRRMADVVDAYKPDCVLFLGDGVRDAERVRAQHPETRFIILRGNCDHDLSYEGTALLKLDGVGIFAAHGHEHGVKWSLMRLQLAAQEAGAQVAAFGHTHQPYCERVGGLWMVNPGSCHGQPCYALIEIEQGVPRCSLHTLSGE